VLWESTDVFRVYSSTIPKICGLDDEFGRGVVSRIA
jgi:hypothetical protein